MSGHATTFRCAVLGNWRRRAGCKVSYFRHTILYSLVLPELIYHPIRPLRAIIATCVLNERGNDLKVALRNPCICLRGNRDNTQYSKCSVNPHLE